MDGRGVAIGTRSYAGSRSLETAPTQGVETGSLSYISVFRHPSSNFFFRHPASAICLLPSVSAIRFLMCICSKVKLFLWFCQVIRPISNAQLNPLPGLHLRPIYPVVFRGSYSNASIGEMSYLGVGFALRCFQRLSRPDFATRRCHWRDNRNTSGLSIPVLSY